MPRKVKQRIDAWSFSRWSSYDRCPFAAKLKIIEKRRTSQGPAARRGQEIHALGEGFVKAEIKKMPAELEAFTEEFRELRKLTKKRGVTVSAEEKWGFSKSWDSTGYFDADIWLRVVCDVSVVWNNGSYARVIDYKTGKRREEHALQTELYGLAGLARYGVDSVNTELWYLDLGEMDELEYTLDQLPELKTNWDKRTKKLLTDTRFAPKSGHHCTWCDFSKSKGGPCRF